MAGMLRALWRFHRLLAGILVLEYAATFAIVLGAVSIAHERTQAFALDSGIGEENLYVVQPRAALGEAGRADIDTAVTALRAISDAVAVGSSVPFMGRGGESGDIAVNVDGRLRSAVYRGDANLVRTLGIDVRRGRGFRPDEIVDPRDTGRRPGVVILSEPLAARLFHAQSPLGRQVFFNGDALVVVGVCAPLAGPQFIGRPQTSYTLLLPGVSRRPGASVIAVRSGRGEGALRTVVDRLNAGAKGRLTWSLIPYAQMRAEYFSADRAVAAGLGATVLAVMLTSLCGVLGLTHYWIGRRRRQIAIRRALGARRGDVLRQFTAESAWLATCGLLLGGAALVVSERWTGLFAQGALALTPLLLALGLTLVLAVAAVYFSLRHLLRLPPLELARRIGG